MPMKQWSLTLHGPNGILSTFDSGETQFVIGTEEAADGFTVSGDDVAARHAWLWLAAERIQVEDLGGMAPGTDTFPNSSRRSPLSEVRAKFRRNASKSGALVRSAPAASHRRVVRSDTPKNSWSFVLTSHCSGLSEAYAELKRWALLPAVLPPATTTPARQCKGRLVDNDNPDHTTRRLKERRRGQYSVLLARFLPCSLHADFLDCARGPWRDLPKYRNAVSGVTPMSVIRNGR